MSTTLLSLPPELLEKILQITGPLQILACESTCRTLRDIVQNSTRIQYQVALYSACKVDGSRDDLTPTHRLNTLRQREQAWNEPRWRDRLEVKLPTNLRIDFGDMVLSHGVLLVHNKFDDNAHAACCALPSFDDPLRGSLVEWHHLTMDFRLCGIRADTGQDLLVCLEVVQDLIFARHILNIHLRTLSTNSPHPEALRATIRLGLPVDLSVSLRPDTIRIHGSHVGILFAPTIDGNEDFFILYDWKSAIRKDCPLHYPLRRTWQSVAFLSNNHIILPNLASECLDLYTYSSEPKSLRHAASFGLPKVFDSDGWSFSDIWLSPDNSQISISPESGPGRRPHHPIYQHDLEESIVVFVVFCYQNHGNEVIGQACAFATHVTSLLSYSGYLETSTTTLESTAIYIPWESWGVESARLISDIDAFSFDQLSGVQGTRFGLLGWGPPLGRYSLTLFDFNRHCMRVDCEIGPCRIGSHPYDPWDYRVHSSLRYRKVTMRLMENWEGFLMDDERIVGISKDGTALDILLM